MRFIVVISSIHLVQHFFMRLIPPLIPVLTVALEYPLWQLGLLVSLFSIGGGIFQAPFGILADRYDRLYLLPTGIGTMGVGYLLFASSPIFGVLLPTLTLFNFSFTGTFLVMSFAMLIAGIGSAVVHPAGYPMISDNVSPGNKGKGLGAFGSFAKFGDATAPAVIGALILFLFWDQILFILGIVGLGFGVLLYLILRRDEFETVPSSERSGEDGTSSQRSSIRETDNRKYLYPLVIIYLFFMSKNFSGEGIKTYIVAFIVVVYAYSIEIGGIYIGPESVASFYFSGLLLFAGFLQLGIGGLTDRMDTRTILFGGALVGTVGFLMLSLLDLGPVMLFVALCIAGAGIYGLAPARDGLISEISPPELEGRTFGYIWTAILLSSSVMPPVVGYIIEVRGMRDGFLVLTLGTVFAAGFASLLFVEQFYQRDVHSPIDVDPND